MGDPCPSCGGPHPVHVVVEAKGAAWRGRNFDAAAAEGAVGAAVMRALGLDPGSPRDFAEFSRRAVVVAVPGGSPGLWEFHAALRDAAGEGVADALRASVREAVAAARGFEVGRVR